MNNTRSPYAIENPEIPEIMDMETGNVLSLDETLGDDYAKIEMLRMALAEALIKDQPAKYICPICHIKVYLCCNRLDNRKRFFYKHQVEDGNCPSITKNPLTKEEIDARKYNGAKESFAHKQMKAIVKASLESDRNFSDIRMEDVWKSKDRAEWRKPDVQALWKGQFRVAFEIQLSTTYQQVIAQRRQFYLKEGGLLCWVFKAFDPSEASLLTQDDIFYNNNRNLFLASEETLKQSQEKGEFVLDCRWLESSISGGEKTMHWGGRHAGFGELTIDLKNQRVFFYDSEGAENLASDELLRQQFEIWWTNRKTYAPYSEKEWGMFREQFAKRKLTLPRWPDQTDGPGKLFNALYTAKYGKAVGWEHPKFISVLHTIADRHKGLLKPLRIALQIYGREEQIRREDKEGKKGNAWVDKAKKYKVGIRQGEPEYEHDHRFDRLIAFLFPEIWQEMKAKVLLVPKS